MQVVRSREPWLLPLPHLVRRVNQLSESHGIGLVVIDPALPAGLIGAHLDRPYAVLVHGAETAIPGRLPGARGMLRKVLSGSVGVIAAGGYPAAECERVMRPASRSHRRGGRGGLGGVGDAARMLVPSDGGRSPAAGRRLPVYVIPPGVDVDRLKPLRGPARREARCRFGLPADAPVVVSVSRLVPRKGMDTLVRASIALASSHEGLQVLVAGSGRDRRRLLKLIDRLDAPVRLLGRLPDDDAAALYGCADVFAMLCRSRWAGLEQEGFGIVFLEAAAVGVPQIAGDSGGVHHAVVHGETGIVLREVTAEASAVAISELLDDNERREAMGAAARRRAVADFSCDILASRLRRALEELAGKASA